MKKKKPEANKETKDTMERFVKQDIHRGWPENG